MNYRRPPIIGGRLQHVKALWLVLVVADDPQIDHLFDRIQGCE